MCSQEVFGATLQDEDHVMVVYHKSSRERMEGNHGTDGHKIIEYGANGGETLQKSQKMEMHQFTLSYQKKK